MFLVRKNHEALGVSLTAVTTGRGENPDRTGPDRPEVMSPRVEKIAYLDREVAIASSHCGIASCREVREQFSLASWLICTVFRRQ